MIHGYFNPSGRPHVETFIMVPGMRTMPAAIPLLLDTGSDVSLIQPATGALLGKPTESLTPTGSSRGVAGTLRWATVPAVMAFQESTWPWRKPRMVYFQTNIAVAMPDQGNGNMPSLLGRDIIDGCRLFYDAPSGRLQLLPRQPDGRLSL